MNYEELDAETRRHMLDEFAQEQNGPDPYPPKALNRQGNAQFRTLMEMAIGTGDGVSLSSALEDPALWTLEEEYTRKGITRTRRRNVQQAATRLGITEFSTWYVRGLARKLLNEGVEMCEVYRAAQPKWEPGECSEHEGSVVSVQEIYDGHRRRYWPEPGDPSAFSIPYGPGCHHLIRRIKSG